MSPTALKSVSFATFAIVIDGVCVAETVASSVGDVAVPSVAAAILTTSPASKSAWTTV